MYQINYSPTKYFALMIVVFISSLVFLTWPAPIKAQQANSWSERQRIPGSHDRADTPYIVSDSTGTVHAFHSQPFIGGNEERWVIFYSQWSVQSGWTAPIDILLPPSGKRALVKGAEIDQNGNVHLIFYDRNDAGNTIFYTKAHVSNAGRATSWSPPQPIGQRAIIETAALTLDHEDNLHILYGSNLEGTGVYALKSADSGESWTEPEVVFLTYDVSNFAFGIQMIIDDQGLVNAVWSVNNSAGAGVAAYFIRQTDDGTGWRQPVSLVRVFDPDLALEGEQIGRIGWPSIGLSNGTLVVMYMVCDPCERRVRHSADNGQTWGNPIEPFDSRGEYGWTDYVKDSSGNLHVVVGDRGQGLTLWHSIWKDNEFTELNQVVPSSYAGIYEEGPLAYHPWFPNTAVTNGNVLLVTWTQDAGVADNGTWYSYKTLDSTQLPAVAPPTPTATPAPTPTPTPVVKSSENSFQINPELQIDGEQPELPGTGTPLFVGFGTVTILLGLFVAFQVLRSKS